MSVRTILVGADDSPGSRIAIDWAAELAADLGAKVVLLHVFEPLAHLEELPRSDLPALRERAGATLRGPLSQPLRDRGVEHATRVCEGEPAQMLVQIAHELGADLIVVGARRQSRLRGLLLGSTSSKLAELTARPVVVLHADVPR